MKTKEEKNKFIRPFMSVWFYFVQILGIFLTFNYKLPSGAYIASIVVIYIFFFIWHASYEVGGGPGWRQWSDIDKKKK